MLQIESCSLAVHLQFSDTKNVHVVLQGVSTKTICIGSCTHCRVHQCVPGRERAGDRLLVFQNQFVSIGKVRNGPSPKVYYKVTANTPFEHKSSDRIHWQQPWTFFDVTLRIHYCPVGTPHAAQRPHLFEVFLCSPHRPPHTYTHTQERWVARDEWLIIWVYGNTLGKSQQDAVAGYLLIRRLAVGYTSPGLSLLGKKFLKINLAITVWINIECGNGVIGTGAARVCVNRRMWQML